MCINYQLVGNFESFKGEYFQVSYFEQNSFKEMDPRLAVKQYSRSSADQESPLPHELRPVLVLRRTMDYLVDKIIPLGETQNVRISINSLYIMKQKMNVSPF